MGIARFSVILFLLASHLAYAAPSLPRDVQSFIKKREGCDHFRGEVPESSEKQSMREVARQINALCKGTDGALAVLKKKYSNDVQVMSHLNGYEDRIEAHPERRHTK
jgi:hypothetical protein